LPNWSEILQEINDETSKSGPGGFDAVRRRHLKALSDYTGRTAICYYSGWLSKRIPGTEINDEDKNGFMLCCHRVNKASGLDLLLHTPGGSVFATESIIHYLKSIFGNDIRVIVPQIAMSAGTIIACAAKSIVLGKHTALADEVEPAARAAAGGLHGLTPRDLDAIGHVTGAQVVVHGPAWLAEFGGPAETLRRLMTVEIADGGVRMPALTARRILARLQELTDAQAVEVGQAAADVADLSPHRIPE
jgi:hypothetical protein